MMKVYLYLISFILCYYVGDFVQPYFPNQVTFSLDDDQAIIAIDEINQRAYQSFPTYPSMNQTSYVMKNFLYAPSNTPQSKYYVQLIIDFAASHCMYETYWKYSQDYYNEFPSHWLLNKTSFEIKNYLNFFYKMIHSNDSSPDEDYWYSNVTCQPDTGGIVPCEEVYFKKNTDNPLQQTQVVYRPHRFIQIITNFKVISVGKLDDKYFDSIPKNWYDTCRDLNLEFLYSPQAAEINLHQSAEIHISLSAPPHRINGNDTVGIQWNMTQCIDCFTLSPKELYFNADNFEKKTNLNNNSCQKCTSNDNYSNF